MSSENQCIVFHFDLIIKQSNDYGISINSDSDISYAGFSREAFNDNVRNSSMRVYYWIRNLVENGEVNRIITYNCFKSEIIANLITREFKISWLMLGNSTRKFDELNLITIPKKISLKKLLPSPLKISKTTIDRFIRTAKLSGLEGYSVLLPSEDAWNEKIEKLNGIPHQLLLLEPSSNERNFMNGTEVFPSSEVELIMLLSGATKIYAAKDFWLKTYLSETLFEITPI